MGPQPSGAAPAANALIRLPDWPERLADYVEAARTRAFEYGAHDCCMFAAGAVEAMTGANPMSRFRYRGRLGAERLIRRAGSIDALVYRTLGEALPSPAQAGRGDVVIADLENGATVGVCLGDDCAFAGDPGIVFRPRSATRVAWRI